MAKPLVLAAIASLLISPSAFAKKPPLTLSAFKGSYPGAVTLVNSTNDVSVGTATVVITVPKSGKTPRFCEDQSLENSKVRRYSLPLAKPFRSLSRTTSTVTVYSGDFAIFLL